MKTRTYKHLLTTIFLLSFFTLKAQLPNRISPADKVFALSRFWQEVNYNFVYLDKVDRKMWDSAYRAMITSVQATANDYEYFRELMRFCALLKDGHTNLLSTLCAGKIIYIDVRRLPFDAEQYRRQGDH
jgi:hypothetical protein